MAFCKEFNAATSNMEPGLPVPVEITVYNDKSFTFIMKSPPAAFLIRKSSWLFAKRLWRPNKNKVGKVTRAQLEEIVKTKQAELNRC